MKTPFRPDRLISLYAVRPLGGLFAARSKSRLCILMYHSISQSDEKAVPPYYRLCTSPAQFEEQLLFLRRNHYAVLPLEQALKQWAGGALNPKTIVLTFDDGYEDFYSRAFPLLQKHGFSATVFLPVGYIDYMGLRIKDKEHLSWCQVKALSKNGISFGSHSCAHHQFASLSPAQVKQELRRSKEIIEDHLGTPVNAFSYPYAFPETNKLFVKHLRDCLQECGYSYGVTTAIGSVAPKQDLFFLPRLPVNSADDRAFFKAKMEGNYNWLHSFQFSVKWAKEKLWPQA